MNTNYQQQQVFVMLSIVMEIMKDNYNKNINLHDVANYANMSSSSFCRYFKKLTNKS